MSKMIPELRALIYEERLEIRRLRGDEIAIFKILRYIDRNILILGGNLIRGFKVRA